MRAMHGPDISGFQQAYSASLGGSEHELAAVDEGFVDHSAFRQTAVAPQDETYTPAVEPYNPAMLPRAEPANPQLERFNQIRNQLLSDEPPAQPRPDPYRAPPRTPPSFSQSGPDQPRPSLRESLLKKPLSSIIRK
jgi:uncharacterized protein